MLSPQQRHIVQVDAIMMLEEDHARVKALFDALERAEEDAKQQIALRLFDELDIHTKLEESIFYPALQLRSKTEGRRLVTEALEAHGAAKELIAELRDLDVEDSAFDDKLEQLRADVESHIEEEEDDMFPLAERILADDAERLGLDMQDLRIQLTSDARDL